MEPIDFFKSFNLKNEEIDRLPALTLAYLGDSVFEIYIRYYLITKGNINVNKLHKKAIHYVSAKAQAEFSKLLLDSLSEKELQIIKMGRNAKSATVAKNADILEYRWATGLEALIGYLYLKKEHERLDFLVHKMIEYREGDGVEGVV